MSKICGSNPKLVTQGSHGHCLPQWKNGRERKACVGLDRIQVPTMKQAGVGMPPPVLTRLSNWSSSASRSTEGSDVTGLCPLSSARVPTATPVIRKYRDTQRRQHFLQVLVEQRVAQRLRSEEHTSELQSLMRISYAV